VVKIKRYYIGLDDTDSKESIGTGALARELALLLERDLKAVSIGVTRHQLLVHPDIPYTSHNSSACLAVNCDVELDEIKAVSAEFLKVLFHLGADPGLCLIEEGKQIEPLIPFARRAQSEIVTKAEALELAEKWSVLLEDHGGSGLGVIGALAASTLRMSGNDGRFISLRGIREAKGELTAGELLERTGVERIEDSSGKDLDQSSIIITNNWIRPNLREHRAVLIVHRLANSNRYEVRKAHQR